MSVNHFKIFSALKGKWNSDFIFTTQKTTSVHHYFKKKALLNLFCSLKGLLPFELVRSINLRTRKKRCKHSLCLWHGTVRGAARFCVAWCGLLLSTLPPLSSQSRRQAIEKDHALVIYFASFQVPNSESRQMIYPLGH